VLPRAEAVALLLATASSVVAAQSPAARPGQLLPLPLTQLDERTLAPDIDHRTFTLTFPQPAPIREVLVALVKDTNLSIVPDPDVNGSFIGELKNVTVRQALDLVLPPFGLDYWMNGSFIRVFARAPETRVFTIDYIASERLGSASAGTAARVTTTSAGDVYDDISRGVQALMSDRASFNVDRKAGLLQVTDFPDRLERIGAYLDAVHDRVHRQVDIDVRIVEVEFSDPSAETIDWSALSAQPNAATLSGTAGAPAGLRVTNPSEFLAKLAEQGTVASLAAPRIRVLNNEPAVIRAESAAATDRDRRDANAHAISLGVTPHVSSDNFITLSLTPLVTLQPFDATAGTATREADTLARVRDGETIVLAGFTRVREARERRVGPTGGWFGRSTTVTRKRVELVILLTPRIVST
jgi:type II secretory pathway component GspD/PulD (secretin)